MMNKDKRAARARSVKKQANQQRNQAVDRSRITIHMKSINTQLEACEEFRSMPADLLKEMATRLDNGEDFPEPIKETCVAILDRVHENLKQFDNRLDEIKVEIDQFKKTPINAGFIEY